MRVTVSQADGFAAADSER